VTGNPAPPTGTGAHRALRTLVGALAILAIGFHATALVVREGEAVLVTRFGQPLRAATEPGLHWKLPWPIDEKIELEMRRRVFETGHTEMLTRDKKNVIVRTFLVWRIADPLVFTQAVGDAEADDKLQGLVTNAEISTLGEHDLSALVSTNPKDLQVNEIEAELLAATAPLAHDSYGIAVEQVRIERLSLPEENVGAVFEQMQAERNRFAVQYKAEGEKESSRIHSEADLEAAQIRAKGSEEVARIKGESAALVAKIYAEAHHVDPELYKFTRSLESLKALTGSSSTVILRTDSEPFSLLEGKPAVNQVPATKERDGK
jgi:membrane protease subunit HflC